LLAAAAAAAAAVALPAATPLPAAADDFTRTDSGLLYLDVREGVWYYLVMCNIIHSSS
jgi:hypothetical protein